MRARASGAEVWRPLARRARIAQGFVLQKAVCETVLPMRLRRAIVVVLLGLACTTAAEAAGSTEARAHYRAGVAYAKSGRWHEAVREFDEAYRLEPTALRLYDVAQVCLQAKQYARARAAYERVVDDPSLSPEQRERARAGLAIATRNVGRLQIAIAGAQPEDIVVVDGARVAPGAVIVDPGPHAVRLLRGGETIADANVDVPAGGEASATLGAPPPSEKSSVPAVPAEPRAGSGIPALAWVLGGAGVAAIGGGAYLAITGYGDYQDVRDSGCAPRCEGRDEGPRQKAIVGDVLMAAGAVSIAAAVWIALGSEKPRAVDVSVAPSRGGGLLGVRASF